MSNQTTGPSNRKLREIQKELDGLISSSHLVTNAEEIDALERKIREVMDHLAACILEQKTRESLDSDEMEELEKEYIKNHPKRMKSDGLREVTIFSHSST